jgi:hypothetical protein
MPPADADIPTRIALLEAKLRIVVLALEGMIVAFVTALIAYFFKG